MNTMLSFEAALALLIKGAKPVEEIELVRTTAACGRVLARSLVSEVNVPPMDNSAMDGYAVCVADVPTPGSYLPVSQRICAGAVASPLLIGSAARIFTGAPIPSGADAVVMQEQCVVEGSSVCINHVPQAGELIRRAGEDIRCGETVLVAGTRLRAQEIGVAASIGCAELNVFRRVKVALFSTGNELVMPGEPLPDGAIYNANCYTLAGLLTSMGCEFTDYGIVPDDLNATRNALREAAEQHDLILTSGGVSVGEEDYVKAAVQAEGALDAWKIAIKPGKPLAYGHVGRCAFIGLPGNPVSGFVTFLMLVRPFILRLQGAERIMPLAFFVRADFEWPTPDRRREFLRAKLNEAGGLDVFPVQSSGVLTSTAWADGLVDTPPGQVIRSGEMVRFLPFSELLY